MVRCDIRLIQMFCIDGPACNNASAATSNTMKIAAHTKKDDVF